MKSPLAFFVSICYATNKFHAAVGLLSLIPKCDKNIKDKISCASCATFFFGIICNLLLMQGNLKTFCQIEYI